MQNSSVAVAVGGRSLRRDIRLVEFVLSRESTLSPENAYLYHGIFRRGSRHSFISLGGSENLAEMALDAFDSRYEIDIFALFRARTWDISKKDLLRRSTPTR